MVQGWCKFLRGDPRCLPPRSPYKSCLGRRPKTEAAPNGEVDTPRGLPQLGRCRPLLPTSSGHGDIKDACNGASGGGCAHPRSLVAVQPRLHHGRLAVRHLAERQHGATLWLALEAARSCRRVHGCGAQVLVAAGYVELGPRLKRSNLEYVILQGSQFHRTKWQRVLHRCSRQPGLVPRWTGWRLCSSVVSQRLLPESYEVRSRRLERSSRSHVLTDSMMHVHGTQWQEHAHAGLLHRVSAVVSGGCVRRQSWPHRAL